MTFRIDAFPDMTRSDAAVALFDIWDADNRERQRATVDAITTVWESRA
ncbi:MAG TPA: hypothetical protein VIZ43_24720 [Trebonia sp.]